MTAQPDPQLRGLGRVDKIQSDSTMGMVSTGTTPDGSLKLQSKCFKYSPMFQLESLLDESFCLKKYHLSTISKKVEKKTLVNLFI